MIICVCKAVSERHIRAAVKSGATRVQDLSRQLGLGTCCGKCLPEAKTALASSLGQRSDGCSASAGAYFANTAEFAV
jgi:bacterioferritin-associated ferredoxin